MLILKGLLPSLITLDKCPGVRPIGIGDTARCIITRAIFSITRGDTYRMLLALFNSVLDNYQAVKQLFIQFESTSLKRILRLPCL